MTTLDTSVARKDFSKMMNAANRGERFVLQRHGKRVAAVVPIRDLAVLRALEDSIDREAADSALKDVAENGAVSWEDVKANLGL